MATRFPFPAPLAATLIALVELLAPPPAAAQDGGSLIPRSLLFSDPVVNGVRLSPDGKRVGYMAADRQGRQQIWLVDADNPGAPLQLTSDTAASLVTWQWCFDGRHVLLVRHGAGGDRLVLLDLASRAEVERMPASGSSIQIVALSPRLPDRVVVAVRRAANVQLKRVNLGNGSAEHLPDLDRFDQWFFDVGLQPVAAREPLPGGFALHRYDGSMWHSMGSSSGMAEVRTNGLVAVSNDGKRVYLVDNNDHDKAVLKEVEARTGRERVIAEDSLSDLLPVGVTLDPATGAPQAMVSYFVRMRRHFPDPSVAGDFDRLARVHPGDVSFAGQSLDGGRWLVRYMNGGPLDYYVYDRSKGEARFLFNDMPQLANVRLAQRRPLIVRARDGLALPCDLYLPVGSDRDSNGVPDRPLPTILYVHGGPWVGNEWNLWLVNRNFQLLANRGYAVIRTDFRSAGGYGRSFMDAGNQEWGEAMRHDLLDIAARATADGIADRSKLAMWGWSYGGYTSFSALGMTPDSFACAISMYGVSDLVRFEESGIERYGEDSWEEWFLRVGDVRTAGGRELLSRHSPINYVERITKPLLVTHGTLDQMVPQEQSDSMVKRMEALGKNVTYFIYPNEPHDYRAAESWESFWAIGERFLHEHLGGAYEPYGSEMARADMRMITGAKFVPGLEGALRGN